MQTISRIRLPIWYWILTALIVLSALYGVVALSIALTAGTQAVVPSWTFWAIAIAAVAILSEIVGCLGLVIRKVWALPAFAVSLAVTVLYCAYLYFAVPDFSPAALVLLVPRALGLWLAVVSKSRKWSAQGSVVLAA